MKLEIDSSDSEIITLKLDNYSFTKPTKKNSSQYLLSFIDECLKSKNKTINDLKEIKVKVGPGSFTGLRVGVTTANILGYVLNIPVNGVDIKRKKYINIKYE